MSGKMSRMDKREYSQKAALVTGGARGIGKAIAEFLAEHGYRVAVCDVKPSGALESGISFIRCDVSREAAVRACIRRVVQRFGRLDALINNAGIASPENGPVAKLSLAEWNRRIATNLTSVFLTTKHAAAHLRRTRGAIVNIASTRALQSEPDTEAYAAAKGGMVALTHALAISLGPDVRVNCVSPGWIDTGKAKLRRADHQQHPAGRVGRVQDIAEMVSFLLSDRSGFTTGANFVVDGGMTRKMIYAE
jgi:NAD(P)-dependent dehydrogenase (short-subunit alcohol dehydrogenase family)